MLTPKDWKSLKFSQSITARISEMILAVAIFLFLAMAASFFQIADQIASLRNMSIGELIRQGWSGINPALSYPGTFVLAFEPFTFGIVCASIALIIGILLTLMVTVRRRNERFLIFLDRYQSSFSGTQPEDEDFEHLIETI